MTRLIRRPLAEWALCGALMFGVVSATRHLDHQLADSSVFTGWVLGSLIALLAAFAIGKKLIPLAIGHASSWLRIHVLGGTLCLIVFWLHTGCLWPGGFYEKVLTVLFYSVMATGFVGILIQRRVPRRLNQVGLEVLFERIPREIHHARTLAQGIVVECADETGSETLTRSYIETFGWYFERPRFVLAELVFPGSGRHWLLREFEVVSRYLDRRELTYCDKLRHVAFHKRLLDLTYAYQLLLRSWLLLHVPLTASLVILAIWHIILMHVYLF